MVLTACWTVPYTRSTYFPIGGPLTRLGVGEGEGYTINAPLCAGSVAADYEHVFSEIFVPGIERFSPDIMIVSAGQEIFYMMTLLA